MIRRALIYLIFVSLFFLTHENLVNAQEGEDIQVIPLEVTYTFGGEAEIRSKIIADIPVREAILYLRSDLQDEREIGPAIISPSSEVVSVVDLNSFAVKVFSDVSYWYEIALQDGQVYTSPSFSFSYEDNRYEWQTLESAPFRLHWYSGNQAYAQEVLAVAHEGLRHSQSILPVDHPEWIEIYIYDSASEMRAAIDQGEQSLIAGHAALDRDVIFVSLPAGPDQILFMEQRIPHEIMHVLTYQATGENYKNLPVWLIEGLASIAELYPNPDYQLILEDAYARHGLLPLSTLCYVFPRDASGALLAYAQSASFTRFLYQQYGTSGLERLVSEFAVGADCDLGVEGALGASHSRLEQQWRQEAFTAEYRPDASQEALSWIVVMFATLAAPASLAIIGLRRGRRHDR